MKGKFARMVVGFILMSSFVGCSKYEDTEVLYGEETPTNSSITSGTVNENETLEFEKDIIASKITYWNDDINTMVYCIDNEIYDYCDNVIREVELIDSEYIYDIYFEDEGIQLTVEIADLNSDEAPRIVRIAM